VTIATGMRIIETFQSNINTFVLRVVTTYIYLLTHSMEQSPSREANRFSASQEIPRTLWSQNVHYRSHNCRPPVPILSQV